MSRDRIERIAEVRAAGLLGWRELPRGLCNRNYLIETRRGRWVARLNGEVAGVDRDVEARVLDAVARAGLGPPLIACDPQRGYLITEYLDGKPWRRSDLGRPRRQQALARRLRQLHDLEVAVPALDVAAQSQAYLERIGAPRRAALAAARARVLEELAAGGWFEHRKVLCHHDLHARNIIGQTMIRFVDWEFARHGHPALELGFVIQYHDLPADAAAGLAAAYYGAPARDALMTVSLGVRLAQLLELLWLAARAEVGELPPAVRRRLDRLLLVWT